MADPATIGIVGNLIGKVVDRVGDYFPTAEEKNKFKMQMLTAVQDLDLKELNIRMKAIVAEARSGSWLAQNWRPITMLTFVVIIANNYILSPYVQAFGGPAVHLDLPPDMWALLKLGIGGYVAGRSVEKAARAWKGQE